jgi:hypothetical protein
VLVVQPGPRMSAVIAGAPKESVHRSIDAVRSLALATGASTSFANEWRDSSPTTGSP